MKTLKNVKQYSFEYDALMNLDLEIIEGAYNSDDEDWLPNYSIKIPNRLTSMRLVSFMDGDQPSYNGVIDTLLIKYNIEADKQLADYPRHGNTLRLFFEDKEKAFVALYFIKQLDNKEVA